MILNSTQSPKSNAGFAPATGIKFLKTSCAKLAGALLLVAVFSLMISEYTDQKIKFLKGRLDTIINPETKGCLMDLIEDIESEAAFKSIKERSYCLGYTAGVSSGMDADSFMDAMNFLEPTYDRFRKSNDL